MKQYKNPDIKYIVIVPLASLLILSVVLITVVIKEQKKHLEDDLHNLKVNYLKSKKSLIKERVQNAISVIEYKRKLDKKESTDTLSNVLKVTSFIQYKQRGYLYIVNKEGILLSHINKKIVGSNAFEIKDPSGKRYMYEGYNLAKESGSAYIEYTSITNHDKKWNNEKKLTYVEYYKPYGWAISTGVYISDLSKELSKREEKIKEGYAQQNRFMILNAIVLTIVVVFITLFLAKSIARKLYTANSKLQFNVNEKTKALEENVEFLKKLIDTVPVPVYIKDENFRFIQCNSAYCDFLGFEKEYLLGKTVKEIYDTSSSDLYHQKDLELVQEEKQRFKTKIKTKSGDEKIIEFYKTSYYHNDKFAGVLGVVIDITDVEINYNNLKEKVAVKTLENLNQIKQYEQEQIKNIKYSSIGKLAAGITHEINTPLTYIKGTFEMMKYDIEDLPQSELRTRILEDSSKIFDGLNRIANIIESMREISQKSSENKEIVNIYATMITALTVLNNRSKQIVDIKLNNESFNSNISKNTCQIFSYVQKQRIEQVWIVLINNALDELVKIQNFEDRKLHITIDSKDELIVIKVVDNAGGIPEELLDNIFEPFTTKKESNGIGMGLNISKTILNENDADIVAYNENNCAVFEARLKLQK